jgi:enoyl-CoA hydratase
MTASVRHLTVARMGGVATVVFDRPPVNAVTLDVIEEFLGAVGDLGADRAVRAVIITGSDRRFCAGADVAMLEDLTPEHHLRVRRWVDVQSGLEAMEKPVVAAINGYALGGGAELALACDVRLMAQGGEIGFPEIRLGFFPGAGGTQRLARVVGPARALRLMMEGRRLTADEAHALGLVDEVVPGDLLQRTARDVAERLATGPTRALGLLKRSVYRGYGRPLEDGLAVEGEAVMELIRTADAREGLSAFLAKRPPRFTGT